MSKVAAPGFEVPLWRVTVLSIFPEMFPGPLGHSLAGKALESGIWGLETVDIRDFASDKHRSVDDTPFGGGPGMVMQPEVIDRAIRAAHRRPEPVVYLTPRGRRLDQAMVRGYAARRVADPALRPFRRRRRAGRGARMASRKSASAISCSPGGEPAAIALIDAVVRLLPGVVGAEEALGGREFRTGIAGISPLHAAGRMAGPHGAGGAASPAITRRSRSGASASPRR